MARFDNIGFFWQDVPTTRGDKNVIRPRPPVPETGWRPPTDFPNLSSAYLLSLDTETYDPELLDSGPGWARGRGHIVGVSIGAKDRLGNIGGWYFPMRHEDTPEDNMDPETVLRWLRHTLGDNRPKFGANLIYDLGWLAEEDVHVKGPLFDIQHAEALLEERLSVSLDACAERHLGEHKETSLLYQWCADYYGGKPNDRQRKNIYRSPPSLAGPYAEADATLPLRIVEKQWRILAERGLEELFSLENRLIPLLVAMRRAGVSVDIPFAERLYDEMGQQRAIMERELRDMIGFDVNVNSGDDLKRAFDAHGLRYNTTANGKASFTAPFLQSVEHPIGEKIVEIRQRDKLRNVFIKSYLLENHVNGKVFCSFNQLRGTEGGTRSGRFSCVDRDTPITTSVGEKRIADIVVGDRVLTHRGRYKRVIETQRKGIEEMFAVTFSNGHTIRCTREHKFLTTAGWKTLNAYLEETTGRSGSARQSFRFVSFDYHDNTRNKRTVGPARMLDQRYSRRYNQALGAQGRNSCFEASAILPIEDGRTQRHDGKTSREQSELQGPHNRRRRISSLLARRWCATLSASNNFRDSIGTPAGHITPELDSASHRRGQKQQRYKQSGLLHTIRSPDNPRARAGLAKLSIEKVEACGYREVFDITVTGDHSYVSRGVISHNSSDPNLQNIPIRTALGKRIRQAFVPDTGHVAWRKYDASQIEYRFLAHFAVGPGADEIRQRYNDDPNVDYHDETGRLVKQLTGLDLARAYVKNVNFGNVYGQGEEGLANLLGLPLAEARVLLRQYHEGLPFVRATMQATNNEVHQFGFITTILGRRTYFDMWEPDTRGRSNVVALPYAEALEKWGPRIKRSYVNPALNRRLQGSAADALKKGMVDCWESGIYDEIGVPRLTVHDELDHSDPGGKDAAFLEMNRTLETALPQMRVPIKYDFELGPNWGQVKEVGVA